MASYRIAYGRGIRYCFRHWFALVALPLALMGAYAYAYQNFDAQIGDHPATAFLNKGLALSGLGFRLGEAANLGTEILGLSVWLMYLTVGWHYAKQVFGVMLVAGRRGKYPISQWQRWLIKLSLFAVGFYSLCIITLHRQEFYPAASRMYFLSLPITNLGLPAVLDQLSGWIVALGAVGVLGGVFGTNYWRRQKLPPRNLLVPWLAFFAWWIPLSPQPEYYFMMVPFFHSLQYLPFAIAAEKARTGAEVTEAKFARRLLVLLAAGFLAFEAIPGLLESTATSMPEPLFFTIAAAVFINVHHFFIDSVIWRGEHPETRRALA
jgi:hypothetical protein